MAKKKTVEDVRDEEVDAPEDFVDVNTEEMNDQQETATEEVQVVEESAIVKIEPTLEAALVQVQEARAAMQAYHATMRHVHTFDFVDRAIVDLNRIEADIRSNISTIKGGVTS